MESFSVNGVTVQIISTTIEVCSLPDGSAIAVHGQSSEAWENALGRKYRIVESEREDVQADVVFSNVALDFGHPTAVVVTSDALLESVLECVRLGLNRQIIVFPKLEERSEQAIVSAYGTIMSMLLSLTDYRINCVIKGKPYQKKVVERLRKLIIDTFSAQLDSETLLSSQVELIKIGAEILDELAFAGQIQATNTVNLLFSHEKRKTLPNGVLNLTFACVYGEVYKAYLLSQFGFIAPPDNNFRMEQSCDFLGVDEVAFIKSVKPIISQLTLSKIRYCLKLNRGEILAEIYYHGKIIKKAQAKITRFLSDCGHSYQNVIDKSDLKVAISLSPDLSGGCGMSNVLKSEGLLDNFL